jgi:hypothetical protein
MLGQHYYFDSFTIMAGRISNTTTSTFDLSLDELSSGLKACYIVKARNNDEVVLDAAGSEEKQPQIPSVCIGQDIASTLSSQPSISTNAPMPSSSTVYDRWTLLDPSTIHYGPFSSDSSLPCLTSPKLDEKASQETFYITTAINYTNGPAHMGVSKVILLIIFPWLRFNFARGSKSWE